MSSRSVKKKTKINSKSFRKSKRLKVKSETSSSFKIYISTPCLDIGKFPTAKFIVGQVEYRSGVDEYETKLAVGFKNRRSMNAIFKKWKRAFADVAKVKIEKSYDARRMLKECTDPSKRCQKFPKILMFGKISKRSLGKVLDAQKNVSSAKSCDNFGEIPLEENLNLNQKGSLTQHTSHQEKRENYITEKCLQQFKRKFEIGSFVLGKLDFPFNDENQIWTAVLVGDTGMCKTQFALANFNHPAHVKSKCGWQEARGVQIDGIVIDNLNFNDMDSSTFLGILDGRDDYTQSLEYGSVKIPAHIPRIVCLNDLQFFWPKQIANVHVRAAMSRCIIFKVLQPLSRKRSEGKPIDCVIQRLTSTEIWSSILSKSTLASGTFSRGESEDEDDDDDELNDDGTNRPRKQKYIESFQKVFEPFFEKNFFSTLESDKLVENFADRKVCNI